MRDALRRFVVRLFHLLVTIPVLHWIVGVRYRHKQNVPTGPCLVVANHNSHLDASLLLSMFSVRRMPDVHPVAAADYWEKSFIKRLFAMLFVNAIPIQRNPARGEDPLRPLVEALKRGESLIFFPEGSRGEAGVVKPFRSGVGKLVQKIPDLLVLPVFMAGPERLWPRGEVVPVPQAVDIIVGKPRSYDPSGDAREIAAEVRKDVLALAPPPPPPPTAPKGPPFRIAICCIDTERRHAIFEALVEALGREGRTLGLGSQVLEADAEGVRTIEGPIPFTRWRPWLRPLAWLFRTGGLFQGQKFVDTVQRAQTNEALTRSLADAIVGDGSSLVDLMAWSTLQGEVGETELFRTTEYLAGERSLPLRSWWRYTRRYPEIWLMSVLDLATPPMPDLVVHLQTDVDGLMRRLRSDDRLERHQTQATLRGLQQAYSRVGDVLAKRRKVTFLDCDADTSVDLLVASVVEEMTTRRSGQSAELAAAGVADAATDPRSA